MIVKNNPILLKLKIVVCTTKMIGVCKRCVFGNTGLYSLVWV